MPSFACPGCGLTITLADESGGRDSECPECRRIVEEVTASYTDSYTPSQRPPGPPARYPGRGASVGRYRLGEEIGRGGMGTVVRAFDADLGREVAIKFILAPDGEATPRFVREAQVTGQLEHPNVVPVHELGVDAQGCPFLAMKLVRGRSLAEILRRLRDEPAARAEWPLGRLLTVLLGVCHALEYAHSRGVLHRDLKPGNVMVGDFGEVYVMDWGVAKVLDEAPADSATHAVATGSVAAVEATMDGTVVGTPGYMPPEQAMGRVGDLDARSDVYALGALLYSLLTYLPPVERGGNRVEALVRTASGEIVPPRRRVKHRIPRELSAVAMKALAKAPADRYQTAAHFRRDLELFLEGRAVSAKDDSAWEMLAKFVKRNKALSAATAVSVAVLAAVIGMAFWVTDAARVVAETRGREAEEERANAEGEKERAEQAYRALRDEQEDKRRRLKASAPAFVHAARLLANDRQFGEALAQARVAREYDPDRAEAFLLEATALIALGRYGEAAGPLKEYRRLAPGDLPARELAALAAEPKPQTAAYFNRLGATFEARRDFVLVQEMARRSERFLGPIRERLPAYRKRIAAAWPGRGRELNLDRDGNLSLDLTYGTRGGSFVTDLNPLEGIPLARLEILGGAMEDLAPLRGMPLVRLDLSYSQKVKDLSPLSGMPLAELNLHGAWGVSDLRGLRGLPLRKLNLRDCRNVSDLSPLRGAPLEDLTLFDCPKVRDLSPLAGMRLTRLSLLNCNRVEDLAPLRGMPLRSLDMQNVNLSRHPDLEPLAGMPLNTLNISAYPVTSLKRLRGMPLTSLIAPELKADDLTPLCGMKLTALNLSRSHVRDFTPLRGMPLKDLDLSNCPHLADLEFVRGAALEKLFIFNQRPLDLSPLEDMRLIQVGVNARTAKGIEVLRTMKSLKSVKAGRGLIPVEQFWELYDKGEFAK